MNAPLTATTHAADQAAYDNLADHEPDGLSLVKEFIGIGATPEHIGELFAKYFAPADFATRCEAAARYILSGQQEVSD